MDPIVIPLGKVRLSGRKVEFEPARRLPPQIRAGDSVRLVLEYDYEEPSADKDATRIRLSAQRGSEIFGETETQIEDRVVADDSQRAHLALEARPRERGSMSGAFQIRIRYERSAWSTRASLEAHEFAHEGTFELEVA